MYHSDLNVNISDTKGSATITIKGAIFSHFIWIKVSQEPQNLLYLYTQIFFNNYLDKKLFECMKLQNNKKVNFENIY